MREEPNRVEIRCPNCNQLIATAPRERELSERLICPGCGQAIETNSAAGDLISKVKELALENLTRRSKSDRD